MTSTQNNSDRKRPIIVSNWQTGEKFPPHPDKTYLFWTHCRQLLSILRMWWTRHIGSVSADDTGWLCLFEFLFVFLSYILLIFLFFTEPTLKSAITFYCHFNVFSSFYRIWCVIILCRRSNCAAHRVIYIYKMLWLYTLILVRCVPKTMLTFAVAKRRHTKKNSNEKKYLDPDKMSKQANLSVVWHVWIRRKENWEREREKSFHEICICCELMNTQNFHLQTKFRERGTCTVRIRAIGTANCRNFLPHANSLIDMVPQQIVFIALTQFGWENFRFICMRHRFTLFWVMTQMWCTQKRQKTVCRVRKWAQKPSFKAVRVRIMSTDVCSGRTNLPLVCTGQCGRELIRPRTKFTGNVRSSAMRTQAYEPIFSLIFISYGFHPYFNVEQKTSAAQRPFFFGESIFVFAVRMYVATQIVWWMRVKEEEIPPPTPSSLATEKRIKTY